MKKLLSFCLVIFMGVSVITTACSKSDDKNSKNTSTQNSSKNGKNSKGNTVEPVGDKKGTEKKLENVVEFLKKEDIDATRLAYTINVDATTLTLTPDLEKIYNEFKKTESLKILVDKKPIDVFRLFYKAISDNDSKTALALMNVPAGKDTKKVEEDIKGGKTKLVKQLDKFNNRIVQIKDSKGKEFLVFQGVGKYELEQGQDKVWKVCYSE